MSTASVHQTGIFVSYVRAYLRIEKSVFYRNEHKSIYKRNVKVIVIGERADSYGTNGAALTHEIKAGLKDAPANQTMIISRVYGLSGKDFYPEDAKNLLQLALTTLETGRVEKPFDYFGVTKGKYDHALPEHPPRIENDQFKTGLFQVTVDEKTNKIPSPRMLMKNTNRLASGHGACPGCGIFSGLELFFKGIEGDVISLFQTGCAYVTSAGYPYTAHKKTFIHNLFQNGAATLSGTVEAFYE